MAKTEHAGGKAGLRAGKLRDDSIGMLFDIVSPYRLILA
jgi:hypothetical protein